MQKEIYNGKIFKLVKEDHEGHVWDIIRHPGGVGVLAVREGRILLVSQYRPAAGKEMLEIPAGKLEYGEDPLACGIRELNEETGWQAASMELIQRFYSTPGFCDEVLWIFQAHGLKPAAHRLDMDPDEDITQVWMPLDEAYQLALSGQICDAKTLIAIYRAKLAQED